MTSAALQKQLATKRLQLEAANKTYTELLAQSVESYKFDSAEGSQQSKRRSLEEFRKQISALETDIAMLERRLRGGRVVSMAFRRR
jgi:hypothetical protein